jgi:VWFA-related protein
MRIDVVDRWCRSADRRDTARGPLPLPQFRSGVVLVPINVRVLDGAGTPVSDLRRSDFVIEEEGVKQEIAEFATIEHRGSTALPRTFVIVLGRGRLNKPTGALDALIEFVRSDLLPQDRVAVSAYLRVAQFSTSHEALVRFLERYRLSHEEIEGRLASDMSRVKGAPTMVLTPSTQEAIARLFDSPAPVWQPLPGFGGGSGVRFHDTGYVIRTLELLRQLEGEKHLIFVVENARQLSTFGEPMAAAAVAARASVSIIQSGGLTVPALHAGRASIGRFASPDEMGNSSQVSSDRTIAEQTGGIASFYRPAREPLTWIARTTQFEYVLGYYPSAPPEDGNFRRVRVTVGRPGFTVVYRHGYLAQARPNELPDIRRLFIEQRVRAALTAPRPMFVAASQPFALEADAARNRQDANALIVDVNVRVDPSRVTFIVDGGQYLADVNLGVFVFDAHDQTIGEAWDRIELKLDSDAFALLKKQRIRRSLRVRPSSNPVRVRVVAYEYESARRAMVSSAVR